MISALIRRLFSSTETRVQSTSDSAPVFDGEALIAPVSILLQQGRNDEAIAALEALLQQHHDLAEAHLLLGMILHSRRQYEDAGDSYTLAQCFKPDWWSVYFQIGLLALDRGVPRDAAAALRRALELGATDARVHNALGAAHLQLDRPEEAVQEFQRALALDANLAEAHSNLGYVLFRHMEAFEEGAAHVEQALHLSPGNTDALCNFTMVLHHRGKTNEALSLCDQLLQDDPGLHEARANRALMLLSKGQFSIGWRDYEARKNKPGHHGGNDLPWPDWDGSNAASKTMFVYAEQGIGDEIMFASCLPEFIPGCRRCIVECHPKLEALFRRSLPQATIVKKDAWHSSDMLRNYPDCKIAIGSLPRFLRNSVADFPKHSGYLHADPDRAAEWRRLLDSLPGHLKVGISWRGGVPSTRRSLRSIPLRMWLPILRAENADFVDLQYTDCAQERAELHDEAGIRLHRWQAAIDDYDETAALVSALDLVISVQTAVVHLAGALGKPVWALIPAVPEWRYGAVGPSMPWYPTACLFRQSTPGRWEPQIAAVSDELETLLSRTEQGWRRSGF